MRLESDRFVLMNSIFRVINIYKMRWNRKILDGIDKFRVCRVGLNKKRATHPSIASLCDSFILNSL